MAKPNYHYRHYAPIEDEARRMFHGSPSLSVDTVARTLAEKYRHQSITKPAISRIRHEVRQTNQRLVSSLEGEAVPSDQSESQNSEQSMEQKRDDSISILRPRSSHRERMQFLEEYALNHITATIAQAREALRTRFGEAVGTKAISDTLALVKQLAKESRLDAPRPPFIECVRLMRAHRISQITVLNNGTFEIKADSE